MKKNSCSPKLGKNRKILRFKHGAYWNDIKLFFVNTYKRMLGEKENERKNMRFQKKYHTT